MTTTTRLYCGDCLEVMRGMEANSVEAICCDPPYGLSFMGRAWDHGVPGVPFWEAALRVAKPGAFLLAFGGTRTFHRLTCAIEDAGWEIRDCLMWLYGSGFPKSMDIGKAIDKHGGQSVGWFGPWFREWRRQRGISSNEVAKLFPSKTGGETGCVRNWELGFNMPTPEQFNTICTTFGLPFASLEAAEREVIGQGWRIDKKQGRVNYGGGTPNGIYDITAPATDAARQWDGWGTALKPSWEPIIMARKPLTGTVADNVLAWGTGGLNVDACRIGTTKRTPGYAEPQTRMETTSEWNKSSLGLRREVDTTQGRWPANLILDDEAAALLDEQSGTLVARNGGRTGDYVGYAGSFGNCLTPTYRDTGGASRFFYCAKASKRDRDEGLEGMPERVIRITDGHGRGAINTSKGDGTGLRENKPRHNVHPTVKPTSLMRWLVRLITPPGGTVLDCFMGSGSTGKAAVLGGFSFIGIDKEAEYLTIAAARIEHASSQIEAQMQMPLLELA